MKSTVQKEPKSTLKISVTVPQDKVQEAYNARIEEIVKNTELPGFRKGQAPRNMVEEKTDMSTVYGDVINDLLRTYYPQALKEHHIQPIANPQVEITEFNLTSDFEFTALVAIRPEVKVGDFEKVLKKNLEKKAENLKKINAEKLKKGEPLESTENQVTPEDVLDAIIESTQIELPDIVVDEETNRMVSRLITQAQSVGLSLEQYLQAQNTTGEQLRTEYQKIATENLTAEFALSELIESQKIVITEEEVDEMINAAGDEETRQSLNTPMQRAYIKSILAKNKVIADILTKFKGEAEKNSATSKTKEETK